MGDERSRGGEKVALIGIYFWPLDAKGDWLHNEFSPTPSLDLTIRDGGKKRGMEGRKAGRQIAL